MAAIAFAKAAGPLVGPARHGYYNKGADDDSRDYRQPLVRNKPEAAHDPHPGRHEKEAQIARQEVSKMLHLVQLKSSAFKGGGKEYHPDDT